MARSREAGFTMIGLLVTVAVINIALGVAVTSWVTLDRRAREAELLWRGRQYVRALRCHQQLTGSLPGELEELLESDCIRRLWADPMTDGGDWELIRSGDVAPEAPAAEASQGPVSQQRAETGVDPAADQDMEQALQEQRERLLSALRDAGARFGRRDSRSIVGVASRSPAEGLRSYRGARKYSEWRFLVMGGAIR